MPAHCTIRDVENGVLSRLEYLGNRSADTYAKKGAQLGRICEADRLVVSGCFELCRLMCKFSAEQEARIGDSRLFDHVGLEWLKNVNLDLDPALPPLPVPSPSLPPPGGGGTGREGRAGDGIDPGPDEADGGAVQRAEWPDLHVWPARKHAILEAGICDTAGKDQGSLAFCTTCGSICAIGGHGGKSALFSDCLGHRSPGRERQLAWILQGRHPSKKGCAVSRATVLSDTAREYLSGKMGLVDPPPRVPPVSRGSLAASSGGGGRGGTGVDLQRGLALFGFSSREEAESLGARARERRRQLVPPPEEDFDP